MSRIQEILAKAERDGTARRPHDAILPPPNVVFSLMEGSAALDPTPFMPLALAAAPAREGRGTAPASYDLANARTASAVLHPTLVAAIAPHSAVAEQYRAIRTRLAARDDGGSPRRSIFVTSPGTKDGKSVTAANLALTMAQETHRHVVLVDADLRHSAIHTLFGLDAGPGLSDVLAGTATLEEALVYLPDYRLAVVPAGAPPQFPTELLGSTAMRHTLDTLRARFDRVLVDLPAVMPLADTGTVAPLADGVVMVVRAGVTKRPALEQALQVFEEQKLLGIVLNDAR